MDIKPTTMRRVHTSEPNNRSGSVLMNLNDDCLHRLFDFLGFLELRNLSSAYRWLRPLVEIKLQTKVCYVYYPRIRILRQHGKRISNLNIISSELYCVNELIRNLLKYCSKSRLERLCLMRFLVFEAHHISCLRTSFPNLKVLQVCEARLNPLQVIDFKRKEVYGKTSWEELLFRFMEKRGVEWHNLRTPKLEVRRLESWRSRNDRLMACLRRGAHLNCLHVRSWDDLDKVHRINNDFPEQFVELICIVRKGATDDFFKKLAQLNVPKIKLQFKDLEPFCRHRDLCQRIPSLHHVEIWFDENPLRRHMYRYVLLGVAQLKTIRRLSFRINSELEFDICEIYLGYLGRKLTNLKEFDLFHGSRHTLYCMGIFPFQKLLKQFIQASSCLEIIRYKGCDQLGCDTSVTGSVFTPEFHAELSDIWRRRKLGRVLRIYIHSVNFKECQADGHVQFLKFTRNPPLWTW